MKHSTIPKWHKTISFTAFLAGSGATSSLRMAMQDWLGLEGYIELCRDHWVHMSWMWGAAGFMFFAAALGFALWQEAELRMVGKPKPQIVYVPKTRNVH